MPAASIDFTPVVEAQTPLQVVRSTLVAFGYQEAITYSFIDPEMSRLFYPKIDAVALENPISADMSVMRPGLLPGLVKAYLHNQNRQQSRIRLFETGRRFVGDVGRLSEMDQQKRLAGVIAGDKYPEAWHSKAETVDFYDLKSHVDALFELNSGLCPDYRPANEVYLHPGRSAEVVLNGEVVGVIGELHPHLVRHLGVNQPLYLFEVALESVFQGRLPRYAPISKFPEVRRDFAWLVDRLIPVGAIEAVIKGLEVVALQDVVVFDVYQGQGIDDTKKSVALGLTWQHTSHTLSDEEINNAVHAILSALQSELGAVVRG
jgi:phenylalanyl-tRNA synthetase beta chain